jgi:hypothetical protein
MGPSQSGTPDECRAARRPCACGADLNDGWTACSLGQRAPKQLDSAPLVGKRSRAFTAKEIVLPEQLFSAMLIHLALHRRCAPTNDQGMRGAPLGSSLFMPLLGFFRFAMGALADRKAR